jgi:hypothetical protein
MKRVMAAWLAAIAVLGTFDPALAAAAPGPFETVPIPPPPHRPHRLAYVCLTTGVGLVGASFAFSARANRAYDHYLVAAVPSEIERHFDESVRNDHWASGSLLGGEALVAAGLYLRFLRRPGRSGVEVSLDGRRCALSLRF